MAICRLRSAEPMLKQTIKECRVLKLFQQRCNAYSTANGAPVSTKISPLDGIRVLDMTRVLAGPYCTMILGDLGAEVIKIERPGTGDDTRAWGPPWLKKESAYFVSINRNKKSIAVNLKSEQGAELVRQLASKCDVLVENYVPAVLSKLGLGYEQMKEVAPQLIYTSITGFGPTGPYSGRGGYDPIAAAVGGLLHITGPENLHLKRQKVTVVVLSDNMASNALPVPAPLEIHDTNAADKWRKFLAAWENYALATELDAKPQAVQVATLLTVIGEDGREVHSTFRDWAQDGDDRRILPVLKKFAEYCQPRKNVPFERYKFNKRMQESGEPYEQYKTALRKLSEACEFDTITPNEILRDRLIFGIHDTKVRERLLRENNLTLAKTDEICRAAESMTEQMRIVGQSSSSATSVHALRQSVGQKKRVKKKETSHTTKSEATKECWNCGRQHGRESKELCPAFGKTCDCCGKSNHFAKKCRQKRSGRARNSVRTIGESEEVFPVREVATLAMLDDSQCVTLKLDSGSYIRFQIDSGAQCNVVPLKLYQRATKDVRLKDVNRCQSSILAFGGSRLTVVGEVHVRVWRGDYKCILVCKLVDNDNIRPILGRKACVGMKLIQYTDNDALHKPATRGEQVYAVEGALISKAAVIEKYATVFGDGIGELEGEYQIRLDDAVDPIQHAPRRVPVALRDRLKATLDDMTRDDIIEAVEKPTAWISSMVVITKKDSKLRICLDPKDLNRAIRRENYQLPTIEDIATRLHGAKVFTVLDVRHGFWHVRLDDRSSYLTTFHTPFGRYRFKRMPFGISSAPEVF
ncbi:hypothetical protein LSAT2_022086 [Lamellibrachia satsuma]|nr:hypothetical protein LSAT2_022086 [Lamellibrachia satsuma]